MDHCCFCPSCNHAVAELSRRRLRYLYDVRHGPRCPRCKGYPLLFFYSYGSERHRDKIAEWLGGVRNPVALPPAVLPEELTC